MFINYTYIGYWKSGPSPKNLDLLYGYLIYEILYGSHIIVFTHSFSRNT